MLVGSLPPRSNSKEKTREFRSSTLNPTVPSPAGRFFRALNCDIFNKLFCSHFFNAVEVEAAFVFFVLLREMQAFVSAPFLLTWVPIMCVFIVQGDKKEN